MLAFGLESMTVQEVRENLADLIKLVAQNKRRVDVHDAAGNRCVMISHVELESLEKAVSVLADTDEFRSVCSSLNQIVAATNQPAVA